MPRAARGASASSIYHVINRGAGRQVIFECDDDRRFFLHRLGELLPQEECELLAWCLMDNHFHLLISGDAERVTALMHRLQTAYAGRFNRVRGHCGQVFGGRFKSEPVESDEYLMTVVRYIHENPVRAGMCRTLRYRWSSYETYCGLGNASENILSAGLVLGVFGGVEGFRRFHESPGEGAKCLDADDAPLISLTDEEALEVADGALGRGRVLALKALPRGERDEALAVLKAHGLGVRQLQRLTGISLGAISVAGRK